MGDEPEPVDMGETPGILSLLSSSLQLRLVSNGPATATCIFTENRLIVFDVEIPSNLDYTSAMCIGIHRPAAERSE
jgi:hypothetical protein